jgi:hypothetical protein
MPEIPQVDRLRDRSKRLFGHRYMLEVCRAIAQADDRVCLTQLLEGTGLSPSVYSTPLTRLVALELLTDSSREGDDYRARWYERAESSLWITVQEMYR